MMEWWEKEQAYADAYNAGRQARDIWKYIPQKYREGIENAFSDSDGYWIWLDEDHEAYDGGADCHMVHEYRVADLVKAIRTIRRVGEQCKGY